MDIIITKGKVYYKNQFIQTDIGIENGKIMKLKKNLRVDSDEIINAKGKYIIPGIIDSHVHLRDLKQSYKETFITGARAAAHGGVTTVLNMPNTDPPATTLNVIKKLNELKKDACVNIELFGGVIGGLKNNFNEIPKMHDFVCGYKIYMDANDFSGGSFTEIFQFFDESCKNDEKLKVMKQIAVHAEDGEMIKKFGRDNKKCEVEAIKFISELLSKFNLPVHICHVSTPDGLEIIKENKENKDKNLTCEVTPHHLFLSKGDFEHDDVNPPLRTKQDRLKLWENLSFIDIIATDHAPHTLEEKERRISGFPGLETSLSLMLDSVNKKRLTFPRLIEMMSEKPAEIFKLKNKGKIEEGFDADIIITDMKKQIKIRGDDFYGKQKWTPFEGWKVKGIPTHTIVNGKIVMEDCELI